MAFPTSLVSVFPFIKPLNQRHLLATIEYAVLRKLREGDVERRVKNALSPQMTQYGSVEGWRTDRLTKCKVTWTSLPKLRGTGPQYLGAGEQQEKRVGRR